MALTFLDLYNECAGQPWSMFDNDATSVEDFESAMRISINQAISVLWNLQPWSFRLTKDKVTTKAGRALYEVPNGKIAKKVINSEERFMVTLDGEFLDYEPDYPLLDAQEGKPTSFYTDGDELYFYPTPDDKYTIEIKHHMLSYGLDEEEESINELVNDEDRINIPEKYEKLFKNCLMPLAMTYAISEETDENHSMYQKKYEDALEVLMDYCRSSIVDRYIVW